MPYDVTIFTVRPATTAKALPLLKGWLDANPSKGKLVACLYSEIGTLNQILLLRDYASEADILAERDVAATGGGGYGIAEFVTATSSDTYLSFPFLKPVETGEFGPYLEVRTYRLKPDGLPGTMGAWEQSVAARVALSPLVGAIYSVSGTGPKFIHIWPWKSLDERQRTRAKAVEAGIWPPKGGPDRLLDQAAEIFLAAPWSPLK